MKINSTDHVVLGSQDQASQGLADNRRAFLQQVATGASAVTMAGFHSAVMAKQPQGPMDKLNLAIIGAGGRGSGNLQQLASENIVAICDVDANRSAKARELFPQAMTYQDFRQVVELPEIDAVVISSPDHTHALAAVMAMRAGKHVYCEKPLAHTVAEARAVRETYLANRDKLATQMGTQIHATDNYRRVVEWVQSGAIGAVREAHVWCNRMSSQADPPSGALPVPDHLNWDLWVGPAPFRPYDKGYHPGNLTWNRYWDIGNGILGDMGSHLIDLPYWALDLQFPATCQALSPAADAVLYPERMCVIWEHPQRGAGPHQQALKLVWYDGHAKPNRLYGVDVSKYGIGVLFVGDNGMLLADYGRKGLLPASRFVDVQPPEPTIPASRGHHAEWLYAAKNDPPATLCNFDYSGKLIEHNLLGAVSHRVGKKLFWDHRNLKATNVPDADKFIHKEYREGWNVIFGQAKS